PPRHPRLDPRASATNGLPLNGDFLLMGTGQTCPRVLFLPRLQILICPHFVPTENLTRPCFSSPKTNCFSACCAATTHSSAERSAPVASSYVEGTASVPFQIWIAALPATNAFRRWHNAIRYSAPDEIMIVNLLNFGTVLALF